MSNKGRFTPPQSKVSFEEAVGIDAVIRQEEEDTSRQSRATEDDVRTSQDGTMMTMEERKALLRQEWVADILPNIEDPNGYWHYCWLTTGNNADPIYRRLQVGYELVQYEQMKKLGVQNQITSGEFAGCVSVNEMLLARIPNELYREIMMINHHERPMDEEELLRANAEVDEEDSEGKPLGQVIGDGFNKLGARQRRNPVF